jgi:tetratricopeptide (TPR) repeat protein
MMVNLFWICLYFLGLFGIRLLTVSLHELGHAIPAILFSKEKVTIYIGSLGNKESAFHFNIGLLEVWFHYNPISWKAGLCKPHGAAMSINQQIIYVICGPVASMLIAISVLVLTQLYQFSESVNFFLLILFLSAFMDLISTLIPSSRSIQLYNGDIVGNDGQTLKRLFYLRKLPDTFNQANLHYNSKSYFEAASLYRELLNMGLQHEHIFRQALISNCLANNYKTAKEIADQFLLFGNLEANDFVTIAVIFGKNDLYDDCIEFNNQALKIDQLNKYALNNKGFVLNVLEKYEEAIPLFNKAIKTNPQFASAYEGRGLARIKTNKLEEGLSDIHYAIELDKDSAYAYRNLGIYYSDINNYNEALELFRKAKTLDHTVHLIDELIFNTERCISK